MAYLDEKGLAYLWGKVEAALAVKQDAYSRPADWLPMPEPQDNEIYLLLHIPDGASSLLAFTVTCTGDYNVSLGTVTDGQFVDHETAPPITSGAKYEEELLADSYGGLTSDGFKQVMVKVSGADILTWEPSAHSKKTSPVWNIAEIACRLPKGTKMSLSGLVRLTYFAWYGENAVTSVENMFSGCRALKAVLELNTANVTNMKNMFQNCGSLVSVPNFNMAKIWKTERMFASCVSLTEIPPLDTSNASYMSGMFSGCNSLKAIPYLSTAKSYDAGSLFYYCGALSEIGQLIIGGSASVSNMFSGCDSLAAVKIGTSADNWGGVAISLGNCSLGHQALVNLFNSLPAVTSARALTLTGNPGVAELTDAEKAIATGKNWTLTL